MLTAPAGWGKTPSAQMPFEVEMDNLMPHLIGDVVPLVTQPMIDYLQGREKG